MQRGEVLVTYGDELDDLGHERIAGRQEDGPHSNSSLIDGIVCTACQNVRCLPRGRWTTHVDVNVLGRPGQESSGENLRGRGV